MVPAFFTRTQKKGKENLRRCWYSASHTAHDELTSCSTPLSHSDFLVA